MVQFNGDVRKKILLQLFLLLGHPFPVVSVSAPPQGHLPGTQDYPYMWLIKMSACREGFEGSTGEMGSRCGQSTGWCLYERNTGAGAGWGEHGKHY